MKNGRPRAKSKARNHTATTVAPMRPAMIPSRSTERCARAMACGGSILAPGCGGSNTSRSADHADAVVGVAQLRGQRRAMGDGAPRVGVPPGPTPAHATGARGRARAGCGQFPRRVGALVEPVGAPFVADAREVGEAEAVGRRPTRPSGGARSARPGARRPRDSVRPRFLRARRAPTPPRWEAVRRPTRRSAPPPPRRARPRAARDRRSRARPRSGAAGRRSPPGRRRSRRWWPGCARC